MTAQLPERAREWLGSAEFATVATIEPDGRPHLSVVWVDHDGDDVLMSTVMGRRKHQNLERDPRVTILVSPKDRPYSYLEVRGTATMTEEPDDPDARALIDRLAKKYRGLDRYPDDDEAGNVRVKVRIRPDKVVLRNP